MRSPLQIATILDAAFGIQPRVVLTDPQPPRPQRNHSLTAVGLTQAYDATLLGTPWVEQLNFAAATDWRGIHFKGLTMPATTMVDVTRKKTVVETAVAGRDGTYKELVSAEDYRVRIRGLIINPKSDDPPHAEMREFHEMFAFQGSIPVEGRLMRLLDIDYLVLTEYNMGAIAGTPGVRTFEITAVSDRAPELEIG